MTVFQLKYKNYQSQLTEQEAASRLENIGKLEDKKIAWIRSDLNTASSNWLTRLIWIVVAKFFEWMRERFYHVNLEMSRALLIQIRSQLKVNSKLIPLYDKAVVSFNAIAPSHGIFEDLEKSIYELLGQNTPTPDILTTIEGCTLTQNQLSILIQRIKDNPESYGTKKKSTETFPCKSEDKEKSKELTKEPITANAKVDALLAPTTTSEENIDPHIFSVSELVRFFVDKNLTTDDVVTAIKKIYVNMGCFLSDVQSTAVWHKAKELYQSKTLLQASFTQYDPQFSGEGKLACTCINMKACDVLVYAKSFESITQAELDKVIKDGIELWKDTSGKSKTEHLEVTQIGFGRLNLKIPDDYGYSGSLAKKRSGFSTHVDFSQVIQDSILNHKKKIPYAVIFTKSPETVCVIIRSDKEFWLFDSHGDPTKNREAYLESFSSIVDIADTLHRRFPHVSPSDLGYKGIEGLTFDLQYNGFTTYNLVKK
jgi:hypothetical protein